MLVFLARRPDGAYASTSEISSARHIPEPYLLHICSELQKAGVIESRRGPQGGHRLARPADAITVRDVVNSLDYSLAPLSCVDHAEECQLSDGCTQRDMWGEVESLLLRHLDSIKIADLAGSETVTQRVPVSADLPAIC